MTELIDIKPISTQTLSDIFRSKVSGLSSASAKNYRIALDSLRNYMTVQYPLAEEIELGHIQDWCASMLIRSITVKTLSHYIDCLLSILSSKESTGVSPTLTAGLKQLKDRLLSYSGIKPTIVSDRDFKRLLNVTKSADRQKGSDAVLTDLLLISLANGAMTLDKAAHLKRPDIAYLSAESQRIADRQSDPRRKYIFPLDQSLKTPNQLKRYLNNVMTDFLRSRNLPVINGSADESLKTLWAYVALKCGASPSETAAALGCFPAGIPALGLCERQNAAEPIRAMTLNETVASVLTENPERWFAMHIRPGIKIDQVRERILASDGDMIAPEIFYPLEEIAKKTGNKITYVRKPVIGDIAFFRCRTTDITPLFSRIGDLAWCYRTGSGPDSTYAIIPAYEMRAFQLALGQFTAGSRIAPIGTLPLQSGDRVVILGGMFEGKSGHVIRANTPSNSDGATIYRVMFPDSNGFEWRVDIDSRLIANA